MKVLIDRSEVDRRIGEMAREIATDYAGSAPLLIGILNGAAQFMMALLDRLPNEMLEQLDYDFVDVSSYRGSESTGRVELTKDLVVAVEGREVLVVDGIVDTGRSLAFVMELVRGRRPRSLKTCTLLDKSARRLVPLVVDYRGFEIEDVFVVGYGMDYDQRYRALRHIAAIE
ncbi:hypoxanthine phosphoribosyltransferase [bacterium]|nr:hypoxanthine phosphoribosyltransferase [bacterium]